MAIIHRGDQYAIPVTITLNGEPVTPDDVTDVRVKIGTNMQSYANSGGLTYDTDNDVWLFHLTETMSFAMDSETYFQAGVKVGDNPDFIYSPSTYIVVGDNIITQNWGT